MEGNRRQRGSPSLILIALIGCRLLNVEGIRETIMKRLFRADFQAVCLLVILSTLLPLPARGQDSGLATPASTCEAKESRGDLSAEGQITLFSDVIHASSTCQANCSNGTTVSVSCSGGCTAADTNCPSEAGHVQCTGGSKISCQVSCCTDGTPCSVGQQCANCFCIGPTTPRRWACIYF